MTSIPSKREARALQGREWLLQQSPGLEIAETLFSTLSDILFCVKDKSRRYVIVNEAFSRRAGGWRPEQLVGKSAKEVFPSILAAGYEQQDDEVFAKGITIRDRIELITQPDGGMGWFVSQKTPVLDRTGQVIALAGISRDLAETKGDLGPVAEIVNTIHRDFAKPLRIEQLVAQSGYSWSQLERKVRNIIGLSPRGLLTKTRVEQAANLLIHTDKPLALIAVECGFYDQAAFSRQFSAATGLPPSSYRSAFR
ncbi:MAG: AraC family transcriptional regulator [Pirellula sp.]|jgi:PAS domain S-box-containing protein|nr:AraC family transcriptional regulator [Pirellula sp.]